MIKKILAWFKPKQPVVRQFSKKIQPSKSNNRLIINNSDADVYLSLGTSRYSRIYNGCCSVRLKAHGGCYEYGTNQMNPIIFLKSSKKINVQVMEW